MDKSKTNTDVIDIKDLILIKQFIERSLQANFLQYIEKIQMKSLHGRLDVMISKFLKTE